MVNCKGLNQNLRGKSDVRMCNKSDVENGGLNLMLKVGVESNIQSGGLNLMLKVDIVSLFYMLFFLSDLPIKWTSVLHILSHCKHFNIKQ